jgi:hypothetical protein
MNKLTLALTIVAALAAMPAFAQYGDEECWNPRAGRFEQVRPGERQNDLDYSRCRATGFIRGPYRETPRECWNPRARHFEAVLPASGRTISTFRVATRSASANGAAAGANAGIRARVASRASRG